MEYHFGVLTTCAAVLVYTLLRRRLKLSTIRDVPGPVNPSWLFGMSTVLGPFLEVDSAECENFQGHQWYLMAEEAGGAEKRFLGEFGNIVRWNGVFGVRLAFHRIRTSVPCLNSRPNDWSVRVGGHFMDRGPEGHQSHPSEIRLLVRKTSQLPGRDSAVDRSRYLVCRG